METKALPAILKGQIRCFLCQRGFLTKEGGWHNHESHQIFLCRYCERRKAEVKPS